MNIFNQSGYGGGPGPMGLRDEAERYAASLGLTRGTPQWGAAIRDFVMNAPSGASGPSLSPMQSGMAGPGALTPSGPMGGPGAPMAGDGLSGQAAGQGFAAPSPLTMPGQPGPGQIGGAGPMADPAGPVQGFAADQGPARPRPSLFRASASSGPSPDFGGNRPTGFGAAADPAGRDEGEALQLAQLQEGGQSFRRGPGTGSRPAQRPATPPQPEGRSRYPTGRISSRHEAPGGTGTVSSGRSDPGGVSYGDYQISSSTGTARTFINSEEARPWARELQGQRPGTAEFNRRWRAIAARDPEAFREAQHNFIGRTHYAPAVEAVRERTRVDLDSMAPTVREVVWSVSVQHGGAAEVLENAVNAADRRFRDANGRVNRTTPAYQRAMIEEIYDARTAYVRDEVIPNTRNADQRQGLRNVIRNRYPRERAEALRALDAESRER